MDGLAEKEYRYDEKHVTLELNTISMCASKGILFVISFVIH